MSYQDIDIERLSAEVNIHTEKLIKFAKKYAEAATIESNKRIVELELEVQKRILELQAINHDLREALKSLLAANKITHSA